MTTAKPPAKTRKPSIDAVFLTLLAALVAARGLLAWIPGMWFWAASAARFLPAWGWALWILSILLLFPVAARRVLPAVRALGSALGGWAGVALAVAAAAGLVLLLPDRTRFVGDFQLRQGSVEESLAFGRLFPQALPLDVLLHHALPAWAQTALGVSPNATARALGAVAAALLAWLALRFARQLGATREQLPAVAALAGCGAWLALFTGYSKAFAEMTVIAAGIAVTGIGALRGRGAMALACAGLVSAGLLLHRSGLGLLPAAALVLAAWPPPWRGRPWLRWAPAALVLLVLAAAVARIVKAVGAYDIAHLLGQGGEGGAGLAANLSPLRLADVANLTVFLVPLAPLLLLAAGRSRAPAERPMKSRPRREAPAGLTRREWVFLLLLAAPFVLTLPLLHPAQGLPRDFDVFAPAGAMLALVLAAVVAGRLRVAPAAAWLTPALLVAALAPPLEYLLLQAQADRGLARVVALVEGPPLRPAYERAKACEFLGSRLFRSGRLPEAVTYYGRAAELGPSPNIIMGWARVAGYAGDTASEERAYRLLLERAGPEHADFRRIAYEHLADILVRRRDWQGARECVARAYADDPGSPAAARMREFIDRREQAVPPGESPPGGAPPSPTPPRPAPPG